MNVLERIFQKLLPAAGFLQALKPDRWLNGDAVRELEESRDTLISHTASFTAELRPRIENSGLYEFYCRTQAPVFHYYRLPNNHGWIRWENVMRVIHRDGDTSEVVFDEKVTDDNRHKVNFWEQPCLHAAGLFSIFLFKGDQRYTPTSSLHVYERKSALTNEDSRREKCP